MTHKDEPSEDITLSAILSKGEEQILFGDEEVKTIMQNMIENGLINASPQSEDHEFKSIEQDINFYQPPLNLPVESLVLSNEEYSGPFNFEVCIVPTNLKNNWEYSIVLNKIFIDMGNSFPVDFNLKNRPDKIPLFIRATPIFSQPQFAQDLVYRCVSHEHPKDPSNINVPSNVHQHIIRCQNPNSLYLGDKNNNERLSVIIPLSVPQIGTNFVRELYQFVCKSSCPTGMNRKPIEVLFTLENFEGKIFGRRVVCVRICSCPKRDKEKEEKEVDKNKPIGRGKKRKIDKSKISGPPPNQNNNENLDMKLYNLNINIIGKKNYEQMLTYYSNLLAGDILKNENKKENDIFRKAFHDINNLIKNIQ